MNIIELILNFKHYYDHIDNLHINLLFVQIVYHYEVVNKDKYLVELVLIYEYLNMFII